MSFLRQVALAAVIGQLLVPEVTLASEQIVTKAGCAVCHATNKKVLGPSYRDIAVKYKGRADAPAWLSARVRNGGKDVWGPVPMPATDASKINDAELKAVVAWILKTPG